MNMSEIFYEPNDKSWKKFTLTGSAYDYLDYKLNNFNKSERSELLNNKLGKE